MAASYREIDYRVRPAKHAERLMMCDAFRRLRFGTVESYQYVGLGSVYFSDFALIHKSLGIDRMISIEATDDLSTRERFLANRPYSNIEMRWGRTTTELPSIDLSLRSIIWLDYDGRLSRDILDDVRSVVTRAVSGTVLAVSVQCKPEIAQEGDSRSAVERLTEELGADRVSPAIGERDLLGWSLAKTYRSIILNEIARVLSQRNGVRPSAQHIEFEQIFNFHYKDGAHMMTVGGVFFDRGQRGMFDQCAFEELTFVRRGEEAFRIDIPKLTTRELRHLEIQMPLREGTSADHGAMPARDAGWYVSIYRYFPNFTPSEL